MKRMTLLAKTGSPLASGPRSKAAACLCGFRRPYGLPMAALGFSLLLALPAELSPQSATLVSVQGYQEDVDNALHYPAGVAVDGAGNVFIADTDDSCVVKVPAFGGTPTPVYCDLAYPMGVAVDQWGNVFIGDTYNSRVVELPADGGAATTIGSGFATPEGVAVDGAGNVYVADTAAQRIVEIPAGGGAPKTIASSSTFFSSFYPTAVAVDIHGNIFFANPIENVVQEVTAAGQLGAMGSGWNHPSGVAVDRAGNVYIADTYNDRVLEMTPDGTQTTVATGLDQPMGIALDGLGNLYVADNLNNRVVNIQPHQASFGYANVCAAGQTNLPACSQSLTLTVDLVTGIELHPVTLNTRIVTQGAQSQDFSLSGTSCGATYSKFGYDCAFTVAFAPKFPGLRQGALQVIESPGGAVLLQVPLLGIGTGPQVAFNSSVQTTVPATVNGPTAIAEDGSGNVFIVDTGNNRVVEMPTGGGAATTFDSELNYPLGVAVDGAGDVFIADYGDHRVVEIPSGGGAWTTVGTELSGPSGVAVDALGDVFISDYSKGDVVEVPAQAGAQQTVLSGLTGPRSIALDGRGNLYVVSDGSNIVEELTAGGSVLRIATEVGLDLPCGIAVDSAGDLFVASDGNDQVLELPVVGGAISIGTGLHTPQGVAVDSSGNVFISDTGNNRVLELPRSQAPALSFAATDLATTSADSLQTISVQNIGNQALNLAAVAFPADFPVDLAAIDDTELCTNSTSLISGQLCEVPVSFTPLQIGMLHENITITDNTLNAAGATQSIALSGTGLSLPAVSLSAVSLSFGNQRLGTVSASQSVTLTNIGGSNLEIRSIAAKGTNASSFIFANTCGSSVAAGASCTIHGHFTPVAAGAQTAAISITANTANSSQTIALTGTGVGPEITLSSTSLSLGSVSLGATSASQSVTLTNTGNASLTITSISVTGTDASSFGFANSCGTSIAAGASCTIHGHFAPEVTGTLTAAVTITSNASNSPQSISLSGTGLTPPAVSLSAISLSFGSVELGSVSASQSVTLTNIGGSALEVGSITVTGADASSFGFANTCGSNVAAGASCIIHGHFSPARTDAMTADITIVDKAGNATQTIALSGTGVSAPAVSLSVTSLSFGTVKTGSTSDSQSFTLTNTGGSALRISSIKVTGTDASSFGFANSCDSSVAAGGSCSIHGHFTPKTTGVLSAAITIADNAGGSPQSIALSGTGN